MPVTGSCATCSVPTRRSRSWTGGPLSAWDGTTTAGSDARVSCFGIADHPVTRDVSHQLRSALDATGADPGEPDLRRALAEHADGIADEVVDTGGDAHASAAYRRQLIAGLVSRQVARAYLRSVRSTRKGESS